jgi:hypothetical protein
MNSNELKQVTVILRQNDAKKVMKGHFEMDASLGSVITKHLNDNDIQDWKQIELRYPLPRRLITPSSNELDTYVIINLLMSLLALLACLND